MSMAESLRALYHLTLAPVKGATHRARLESLYVGQADAYDASRRRLLHGREDLYRQLTVPAGGVWVELGAGTGSNLELLGDQIHALKQVHLVDLCPSLLRVAEDRIRRRGWANVATHLHDATSFQPPEPADVVVLSYALTMIPDWFLAIDQARRILKPGGVVAAVDYYVSRTHPAPGLTRHGWWMRTFAPTLFARNSVHPSPDHVPYLHLHFEPIFFEERTGRLPWLPIRAPYYLFAGRRHDA